MKTDDMQFGFMQERGSTDAISSFCFGQSKKAFYRVPRQVLWWAMRRLGVDEWIIQFVQAMYHNVGSKVHIENRFSDSFCVNVGVH